MTSYGQDEQVAAEALDGDEVDPTRFPPDEAQFDGAFLSDAEDADEDLDSRPAEELAMHVTDLDGASPPDIDDLI